MAKCKAGELTECQREWCRLVVSGVSKGDAYRKAFNKHELSAAAVSKAANRLSNKEGILSYLSDLRRQADRRAVLSREQRMEMLSSSASLCHEAGEVQDMVRCIAELNKMDGAYEPERVQVEALTVSAVLAEVLRGE